MNKDHTTFLVAHTDEHGKNVAQATVTAVNEIAAKDAFRLLFPQRAILTVGIKGLG